MKIGKKFEVAILLCAGRGIRLTPLVKEFGKPLVDLNGKPAISYCLDAVHAYTDHLVVVANPVNHDDIRRFLDEDGRFTKANIALQEIPLGVADAVKMALRQINAGPAVIVCGDNVFPPEDVAGVLQAITESENEMAWTFRQVDLEQSKRFAVLECIDGVSQLVQKPPKPQSGICWCGPVAVRNVKMLRQYLDEMQPPHLGELEFIDIINLYIRHHKAVMFEGTSYFFDVGTPDIIEKVCQFFQKPTIR